MITEFGVNNVKKFHGWSILPFSDITILVGGNSSGKSSFIKALILLIDNITNRGYSFFLDNGRLFFNFNAIGCENVNLGTFERVINDNSNKGPINICIKLEDNTDCRSIEFTINQFEADETLGYVSEIKVIDIVNGIKTKYKFNFTHHTVTLSIPYQDFIKSYQEVGTFRSQKIHDVKWIWEDMVDDYLPSDARHMAEEKLAILDSYSNELEKTHQPIIEIDDNLNGKLTLEHLKEPIHITNGYIEAVGAFKLSSHGDIISSAIDGIIIEPDNINYAHASSRITNYDKDSIIEKYLRRINIERNATLFHTLNTYMLTASQTRCFSL